MRVLDVGCGLGALVREALRLQPAVRLIGLDPDQDMLRHARSQVDGVRWAAALAQALPFSDNTLHHITTTLMLHHLTRDQKQRALAEAVRVLRPGGRLFVTDWTAPKKAPRRRASGSCGSRMELSKPPIMHTGDSKTC